MSTLFIILISIFFVIITSNNRKKGRRSFDEMPGGSTQESEVEPITTLEWDPQTRRFVEKSAKPEVIKDPANDASQRVKESKSVSKQSPARSSEGVENQSVVSDDKVGEDLDITAEKLVVYSAIMEPKYKDY